MLPTNPVVPGVRVGGSVGASQPPDRWTITWIDRMPREQRMPSPTECVPRPEGRRSEGGGPGSAALGRGTGASPRGDGRRPSPPGSGGWLGGWNPNPGIQAKQTWKPPPQKTDRQGGRQGLATHPPPPPKAQKKTNCMGKRPRASIIQTRQRKRLKRISACTVRSKQGGWWPGGRPFPTPLTPTTPQPSMGARGVGHV